MDDQPTVTLLEARGSHVGMLALGAVMTAIGACLLLVPDEFSEISRWSTTSLRVMGGASFGAGLLLAGGSAHRLVRRRELRLLPHGLELLSSGKVVAALPYSAIAEVGTVGSANVSLVVHPDTPGLVLPGGTREREHSRRLFGADYMLPRMEMSAPELVRAIILRLPAKGGQEAQHAP